MSHLFIASDHAGVALKQELKAYLSAHYADVIIEDLGTQGDASVDYPDYGFAVAEKIAANPEAKGIVICGSGIGISIAANRIAGVRAALCHSAELAGLAREHNNANVLALGARVIDEATAKACVDAFMKTPFAGGRHEGRVKKLG